MIFERSILKEQIALTGVISFVLFTIMTVFFLVRTLDEVSAGMIALDLLPKYILIVSLGFFPLTIVATVMVAIISTISRLYKDSEMVVWQTSGLSYWSVFRPVVALVLPMVVFLLFVNVVLVPWSNQKLAVFESNSAMTQLSLLKSGSFQSIDKGAQTIFVENVVKGTVPEFEQIFMASYDEKKQKARLVFAQSAKPAQDEASGAVSLNLRNGQQYILDLSKGETYNAQFGLYALDMSQYIDADKMKINLKETPVNQLPIAQLYPRHDEKARAELFKRLSNAMMLIPIAVFAIAIAYSKPRTTRNLGMLVGILVLIIYSNLVNFGGIAIGRGQIGAYWAFIGVHGGFLLLGLLMLLSKFNIARTWWTRWRSKKTMIAEAQ